jgi:hypothetical protein
MGEAKKFKVGQRVWYLPQMRMCLIIGVLKFDAYDVEVMDSGQRFMAHAEDLELCEGQKDAN